ncbi:MAG: hypothetical protein IJO96_06965, partial [Oscillospiraceae bacterium]|nr:hypothetical protein [Oscillospiraceae bacterium]
FRGKALKIAEEEAIFAMGAQEKMKYGVFRSAHRFRGKALKIAEEEAIFAMGAQEKMKYGVFRSAHRPAPADLTSAAPLAAE